jgi:uncharacterized delta-60 repeat protein
MKLKKIGIIIANLFCVLSIYINVHANPGDLDTTFDSDGFVITPFSGADTGQEIAVQTDGKIIVVGYSQNAMGYDFALARFNSDGSPDTGFGTGGKVFSPEIGDQQAQALLIQPDGKIIVVGYVERTSNSASLAVFRYHTDGSFDSTFGTGGKAVHAILNDARGYDAVLQPDGKIVIAGSVDTPDSSLNRFTIFRLNTDGSLDTSFNSIGYNVATTTNQSTLTAICVALQPDGKIVAAGQDNNSVTHWGRFNSDGTIEGAGLFQVQRKRFEDVAIQSDGKIVFVGNDGNSNGSLLITRYNTDKTLDKTFGNFGVNTAYARNVLLQKATSVVIQPSGRIVVGTISQTPSVIDSAVARFNSNGFLDVGFGNNGTAVTSFTSGNEMVNGIALQPDGKIVTVGAVFVSGSFDFSVARFDGSNTNTLPNRTPFDYDGDGRADVSVLRASANTWYQLYSFNPSIGIVSFGSSGDIAAPADYDGDGRTDIGIYRRSTRQWWYLATSTDTIITVFHQDGVSDSIPRPSDVDGDGKVDLVLYSPTNSVWTRKVSTTSLTTNTTFGIAEDKPLVGDFDGDGKGDLAVFRPSTGDWWYASSITGQYLAVHWGASGDIPAPGDYDGDGKTDFVVYRPSDGGWYILYSTGSYTIATFGLAEDKPVPADYDGDGKTDIAVFRPSTGVWYLLQTTAGFGAVQWGVANDLPTENAFIP